MVKLFRVIYYFALDMPCIFHDRYKLFLFIQLYDLIKSKVESPDFLEKLGSIHASVLENSYGK